MVTFKIKVNWPHKAQSQSSAITNSHTILRLVWSITLV